MSVDTANVSLASERMLWLHIAEKLATPVLNAASQGLLKQEMPVEVSPRGNSTERASFSHLEAVGRLLCGLAPWLELGASDDTEGQQRAQWGQKARLAIDAITNPLSPDALNFSQGEQPLVDAAFLAQALLRAPKELWEPLSPEVKTNVIIALRQTRRVTPALCNWLLFSATIEAFFAFAGEDWDRMRIDYALHQHSLFYKGDGTYGDGPHFAWDYYNSYVIHPMIVDVVRTCASDTMWSHWRETSIKRLQRYSQVQESFIAPDGTYPMLGRSSAYRCGAFGALAQAILLEVLPDDLSPGGVRHALTTVLRNQMLAPDTYDSNGWLQIGFCGHQNEIGEPYISTGSLYLCSIALLPLGLPASRLFWTAPASLWSQARIWSNRKTC